MQYVGGGLLKVFLEGKDCHHSHLAYAGKRLIGVMVIPTGG